MGQRGEQPQAYLGVPNYITPCHNQNSSEKSGLHWAGFIKCHSLELWRNMCLKMNYCANTLRGETGHAIWLRKKEK